MSNSLLILYIKSHIKLLLLACVCLVIFIVVFVLYNIPLEVILYASILCSVFGGLITLIDFILYRKKKIYLREYEKKVTYDLSYLPKVESQFEEEYQNLLHVLFEDRAVYISKADKEMSDMIDYYTLWAHQIKTPIAAMRLLLQTEDKDNFEIEEQLFKIEQYVEMVLQYLRSNNINNDLSLIEYDLDTLVKQAVRKYSKLFIRKKINLNYEPLNMRVITDEKWLVFVIEQILSNALKYTNEGSISIYGVENKLVIEDTGIGISAEDILRVGEKGFTGFNGRSDKKSTGIGLYLCKKILTMLSHEISIESESGKGTKITIDLSSYLTKK